MDELRWVLFTAEELFHIASCVTALYTVDGIISSVILHFLVLCFLLFKSSLLLVNANVTDINHIFFVLFLDIYFLNNLVLGKAHQVHRDATLSTVGKTVVLHEGSLGVAQPVPVVSHKLLLIRVHL